MSQDKVNRTTKAKLSQEDLIAALRGLNPSDLTQIQSDVFGNLDQYGLPQIPDSVNAQTDIAGMVSVKDRERMRKAKRMRTQFSGAQGSILGSGVPTAPSGISASKSILGL